MREDMCKEVLEMNFMAAKFPQEYFGNNILQTYRGPRPLYLIWLPSLQLVRG